MQTPAAVFEMLPSEVLTMIYRNVDNIFDLQNLMLASSHVWRHLGNERQIPSILDDLLQNGFVHPQVALTMRIAAHLRCGSPPLMTLLGKRGLNAFAPGLRKVFYAFESNDKFLDTLPQDMKPSEARRLLTTSSAIHATTLHCVDHHLRLFHSLRPVTVGPGEGIKFDLQRDTWADLPTSPRSPMSDTGPLLWREMQQMLKAFWMIYFARVFFASHRRRAFELHKGWQDMEVDDMRPIDLFGFHRQGKLEWTERKRPRDYLFHAMQLFLTAEGYLNDVKPVHDLPLTTRTLPFKRTSEDTQAWPDVSDTMEHFVRLFKKARSLEHGDGFYPWRRLGFAIWDIERLRAAGLVHDAKRDRQDDRVRWLSVIREEDFGTVQSHQLIVFDILKQLAVVDETDYEYPEDSDESSRAYPYPLDWGAYVFDFDDDSSRKSLSLEFGRQAGSAS